MALEIERRFLVVGQAWRERATWRARLRQGYLVRGGDGLTLRVRLSQPEASRAAEAAGGCQQPAEGWLTLKAPPPLAVDLITRMEFEYAIPIGDAEALLALTDRQVIKCRYGLDLPGGDWVLDVFEGANAPLVLAEVELASADQPLVLPPWCVLELSGRHELSNAALAERPLAAWSEAERRALLNASMPG